MMVVSARYRGGVAIAEISVRDLDQRLKSGAEVVLLDVREAEELEISVLPGVLAIPMGEVAGRISELDPTRETVVVCRSGARSGQVTEYLAAMGFRDVKNLTGGMNAWAREVDPSLRVY